MTPKRVLIITGDPLGPKLAGPAIRAWNMAELISREHEVRLLSLTGVEPMVAPFELVHVAPFNENLFSQHHEWADVIIFQGHALLVFDTLRSSNKVMVIDIYDPMHLEQLEQARELDFNQWVSQVSDATQVLNDQLVRGDFFLCASERQRQFWLGQLAGQGRINPYTYQNDPDLTKLIDIAPFGLSRVEPQHNREVLKGVHPNIASGDKLILWGGGLYNWFDPLTLIKAVAALYKRHPSVRLFFQGTKHPHPGVPEMEIVSQSRELARQLGVLDTAVIFNSNWVDFDDRQNYLTEADVGVSTHHAHIETTFSFRTRILDYLWARLPMVVTEGDHFADLVRANNLGFVVPAGDAQALERALERALFDDKFITRAKRNVERVRKQYFWEVVLAPLLAFVDDSSHAADRGVTLCTGRVQGDLTPAHRPEPRIWRDAKLAVRHLKAGGVTQLLDRVRHRLAGGSR